MLEKFLKNTPQDLAILHPYNGKTKIYIRPLTTCPFVLGAKKQEECKKLPTSNNYDQTKILNNKNEMTCKENCASQPHIRTLQENYTSKKFSKNKKDEDASL